MIENNDHGHVMDLNAVNVRLDDTMSMMIAVHMHSTAMNTNYRRPYQKMVRIDRERRRPSVMHIEYYLQDCHGDIPLIHTAQTKKKKKKKKRNILIFERANKQEKNRENKI